MSPSFGRFLSVHLLLSFYPGERILETAKRHKELQIILQVLFINKIKLSTLKTAYNYLWCFVTAKIAENDNQLRSSEKKNNNDLGIPTVFAIYFYCIRFLQKCWIVYLPMSEAIFQMDFAHLWSIIVESYRTGFKFTAFLFVFEVFLPDSCCKDLSRELETAIF